MNDQQLDEQIRSMVASAVAGAPPAPELPALHRLRATTGRRDDRTGWYMAGAGIAAAAALVGVLVWADGDGDPRVVPATTIAVPTSAPATVAPTVESTVPSTVVETSTPTTAPAPSGIDVSSTIITAGPDGVWRVIDGVAEQLVTEPMSMALQLPDGSLIMQRRSGWSNEFAAADTVLLGWSNGDSYELLPGDEPTGWIRLHDVALVNGELTVLYAVEQEARPQATSEDATLVMRSLDTGNSTVVTTGFGGWEQGYSRMHLAETGLIVGEFYQEVERRLVSFSEVTQPGVDAAELGLDPAYFECNDCPRLYTVSRDGSTVAWLDGTQLIRHSLAGSGDFPAIELGEASLTATGLELGNGYAVLSFGWGASDAASPRLLEFGSGTIEAFDLPGLVAGAVISPTPPWRVDDALTAAVQGQSFATTEELYAAVEQQILDIKYAAVDPVEPVVFGRQPLSEGSPAIIAPNFDDSVPSTWYRVIASEIDGVLMFERVDFVDVCRNFTFSTPTHLCV